MYVRRGRENLRGKEKERGYPAAGDASRIEVHQKGWMINSVSKDNEITCEKLGREAFLE